MKIALPRKVVMIIKNLQLHGYEAYAVGGCVRDSILARRPKDWDITTSARPEEVKKLFRRTVDTGIEHGTVTVLLGRDGEDPLETKYVYSTHSELNAILNYSGGSLAGAKLYVSLFPCNECAKAIIQAGIKEVIYDCDKYADTPSVIASKRMMDAAGVRYHQYHRTNRKIEIEL